MGRSRSKNGVASLAYVPAVHVCVLLPEVVDARHKAGHDIYNDLESVSPVAAGARPLAW